MMAALLLSLLVTCIPALGAALAVPAWFAKNMIPAKQAAETMQSMTASQGTPTYIVVDANNVRGAVNFRLSKLKLTTLIETWASKYGLGDRIVLCWDHGLKSEAMLHNSICHAWAGARQSADDLIANSVVPGLYETGEQDARLCVVTTDRELIQRCKRAASESGASMGRLRLLGTRKFVSLLMHASPPHAYENVGAEAHGCEIASAFERSETSVRRFALTLRKRRMHERRRRRRPDGFSAPYAERTWHRVMMSEKLRRLLEKHARRPVNDASGLALATSNSRSGTQDAGDVPLKPKAAAVNALALRLSTAPEVSTRGRRRASQGTRSRYASLHEDHLENDGMAAGSTANAELLLGDVRLDGRQRAILLKYGGTLAKKGRAPPAEGPRPSTGAQVCADSPSSPAVGNESGEQETASGALQPRSLPTRRQRRRQQRADAAVLLKQHGVPAELGRDRRRQVELLERREQLLGLDRWLNDDAELWDWQ